MWWCKSLRNSSPNIDCTKLHLKIILWLYIIMNFQSHEFQGRIKGGKWNLFFKFYVHQYEFWRPKQFALYLQVINLIWKTLFFPFQDEVDKCQNKILEYIVLENKSRLSKTMDLILGLTLELKSHCQFKNCSTQFLQWKYFRALNLHEKDYRYSLTCTWRRLFLSGLFESCWDL